MLRKRNHIHSLEAYIESLNVDIINLSIHASRFGWNDEIKDSITNNANLIRKYERRLRLIKM